MSTIDGYSTVKLNRFTRISVDLDVFDGKIFCLVSEAQGVLHQGKKIDVFSVNGEFLTSIALSEGARAMSFDRAGFLYLYFKRALEPSRDNPRGSSGMPAIKKYRLDMQ